MRDKAPPPTWHRLVKERDPQGLDTLLDDDAVFVSPVVHTPQRGKRVAAAYLTAFRVFFNPTFRYVREIVGSAVARSPPGPVLRSAEKLRFWRPETLPPL